MNEILLIINVIVINENDLINRNQQDPEQEFKIFGKRTHNVFILYKFCIITYYIYSAL